MRFALEQRMQDFTESQKLIDDELIDREACWWRYGTLKWRSKVSMFRLSGSFNPPFVLSRFNPITLHLLSLPEGADKIMATDNEGLSDEMGPPVDVRSTTGDNSANQTAG